MENLTGGTPPVRYLPCVVPCKLYFVQDLTSGGLLGVWGKWMKHAKYIYNIQDFNPEQVLAVGYTKSKLITDRR